MSYTDQQKLDAEVEKLRAETLALRAPWRGAGFWFSLPPVIIAIVAAIYQFSRNDSQLQQVQVQKDKAEIEGMKAQMDRDRAVTAKEEAENERANVVKETGKVVNERSVLLQERDALSKETTDLESKKIEIQNSVNEIEVTQGAKKAELAEILAKVEKAKGDLELAIRTKNEPLKASALDSLSQVAKESKIIGPDSGLTAENINFSGYRMGIYYGSPQEVDGVSRVRSRMGDLGLRMDKLSNVSGLGKRPDTIEVRYFSYPRDTLRAQKVADILRNEFGLKNVRISYVIDPVLEKDTWLEVWFDNRSVLK
jgi:hypothetical protein